MRIAEVNDNTMVEVFNDYHSSVSYKLDRITRSWDVGAVKKIKMEELYEAVNAKGARFLFDENILLIKDSTIREVLGLKSLDQYDISQDKIIELLKESQNTELEDVLAYCSETTLSKIVQKAIELPVNDMTKANIIKSYSGMDIVSIIKEKEESNAQAESQSDGEDKAPARRRKIIKE